MNPGSQSFSIAFTGVNALGSSKATSLLASTKKQIQDYFESVMKEFLKSSQFSSKYNGSTTKVIKLKDTLTKPEIATRMALLKTSVDQNIDSFILAKPLTLQNLQNYNQTILQTLVNSLIFKYYIDMNWLKMLDERLSGLYGK